MKQVSNAQRFARAQRPAAAGRRVLAVRAVAAAEKKVKMASPDPPLIGAPMWGG